MKKWCFILLVFSFIVSAQKSKPCIQITAEFSEVTASIAEKEATVAVLHQRCKNEKVAADITLEGNRIIAKLPCMTELHHFFHSGKFGIYESPTVSVLQPALDELRKIIKQPDNKIPILDEHFAAGAQIGICLVKRTAELLALFDQPEIKKLLPADVAFYCETPKPGDLAVAVYAVKKSSPLVTVSMIKETGVQKSRAGQYELMLTFKDEYIKTWADITTKNIGKQLPIFLGDEMLSCPMVTATIEKGKAAVSGNLTKKEAEGLAQKIKMSLPLQVLITEEKLVGE